MATDVEQIRRAVSDIDEEIKQLDLHKRRLALVRRDLLIAIGDKRPILEKIDEYTGAGGKKIDLRRYRFKKEASNVD